MPAQNHVGLLGIRRFSIVFVLHDANRSSAVHHLRRLEPGASALTCRDRWTFPSVIGYFLAGWRLDDSQSEAVRTVLDGGTRRRGGDGRKAGPGEARTSSGPLCADDADSKIRRNSGET